jgi:Xaa-Pro aminopeptidase
MSNALDEDQVSRDELERRWSTCREAMQTDGLDALIALADNDYLGGAVKWLSDVSAFLYPKAVVLFHDSMMVIDHGPLGGGRALDGLSVAYPGASALRTTAEFASVRYTRSYSAALAAAALKEKSCRRIGLIGMDSMPHGFVRHLRDECPETTFVDASEPIDALKARKSGEEIALLRRATEIQDLIFERVVAQITPGLRQCDVVALARYESSRFGSEQGVFLCRSAPLGKPTPVARGPHFDRRVLQAGDYFSLLVENNALSGFYAELGRTIVLGRVPQPLHDAFEIAREAQADIAAHLTPGAPCADVYARHADFMRSRGQQPGRRITAHGQGYDLVERPLVRQDETMRVEAGMFFAIHPSASLGENTAFICDNYLVGEQGGWLHSTPKRLYEVDL